MSKSRYGKRYSTSRSGQGARGTGIKKRAPYVKRDFRESILTQCIVCGAVLAIVLFISLINIDITKNARAGLKSAISENMTMNDFKNTFNNAVASITGVKESVSFLFNGPQNDKNTVDVFLNPNASPVPTTTITPAALPVNDFRIDEDILEEINNRKDYYGVLQTKNNVTPETVPMH